MAIPESQLDIWSKQGSVTQSAATYQTIRNALNDSGSPYYSRSFTIFLQGSYGNDTNVYRESDVDVVIRLNDTFYYEDGELGEGQKAAFAKASTAASYGYYEFKADVTSWLKVKFGDDAKIGTKAITIVGNGSRRNADVIVCSKFRRYRSDSTGADDKYHEGICFFRSDGARISNFPKQHSDNCTAKHQATNSWFKPTVRIYKNMRNRMVDAGALAAGVAPSYFLEGMLWNVPTSTFGRTYEDSVVDAYNWITRQDTSTLACANDLFWLVREGGQNCWSPANFDTYIAAFKKYWNEWGR